MGVAEGVGVGVGVATAVRSAVAVAVGVGSGVAAGVEPSLLEQANSTKAPATTVISRTFILLVLMYMMRFAV